MSEWPAAGVGEPPSGGWTAVGRQSCQTPGRGTGTSLAPARPGGVEVPPKGSWLCGSRVSQELVLSVLLKPWGVQWWPSGLRGTWGKGPRELTRLFLPLTVKMVSRGRPWGLSGARGGCPRLGVRAFSSHVGPLVCPLPQDPQVFEGGGQRVAQEGRVGHVADHDDVLPCKRRALRHGPCGPHSPRLPRLLPLPLSSLGSCAPAHPPRCPAGGSGPSPWRVIRALAGAESPSVLAGLRG